RLGRKKPRPGVRPPPKAVAARHTLFLATLGVLAAPRLTRRILRWHSCGDARKITPGWPMQFNELINSGWARQDSQADVVLHELEEHAALADTRSRAVPYWLLILLLTAFPSALLAEPYRVAKQADIDAMPADVKHVVCDPTVTDKVLKGLLAAKELEELD